MNAPSAPSLSQLLPWWAGLCVVAAVAWAATIAWSGQMGVGAGAMGLSLLAFLVVWIVMMAAMMIPSVAPTAVVWIRSVAARGAARERVLGIVLFVAGYLVAWAAFGVAVYVVLLGTGRLVRLAPHEALWLGAAIFLVAGIYQLSPLKEVCLHRCRTPVGALIHYASYRGVTRDLRVGLHHGLFCVACCWGLMIVLVAVGVMNVPAMIGLAGVVLLEKVWRHGALFSRAVGVGLLALAVLVPFVPALLPGLQASSM